MTESVFDRLYHQSTAASRAASIHGADPPSYDGPSNSTSSNRAPHRQRKTPATTTRRKDEGSAKSSMEKGNPEGVPTSPPVAVAPPMTYSGPWRIASTSTYGRLTFLDPGSLKLSAELHSFDQGEMDARRFACHLIAALFRRDHMAGRHWDYDAPSANPITESGAEENNSNNTIQRFKVEREATWDWKDIYSVATAKGTISFNTETNEIRLEDYSYYAAG
ncbi:unnamed protein product [Cylindrotheca closterium]|uniref:Uncharacterized protein n=1 Tax=Cylindrotheca closterium TaxID=2856 RepID=A0AAD2CLQ4_9STRA|nr:unnamed protein product [Cylindrotheca closterium]